MQSLVVRRPLLMGPLMPGMTLIAFVVSHSVPADPVAAHLGQRAMEDPTIVSAFRQQWGLDKPLPEQYLTYLKNLGQGNMGVSLRPHMPVAEDVGRYLPASAELAIVATVVGILLGIPFGVISAVRRTKGWAPLGAGFPLPGCPT